MNIAQILCTFQVDFHTLRLSVALLYDTLIYLLSSSYLLVLYCVHCYVFLTYFFMLLLYFITFTPKCLSAFVLAVAAISAEQEQYC